MKLDPIITSLAETDAYKLSMGQAIFHQFPTYKTTWSFKCRNKNVKFTPEMLKEIEEQIDSYCKLKFKESELKWMAKNLPWIKEDYIAFLRFWHPRREEIHVNEMLQQGMDDSGLAIDCTGTWLNTSMYEIALLAIVNEVYFAFKYGPGAKDIEFQKRTMQKFEDLKAGKYDVGAFSEFGLRRRYSKKMQDWLINFIVDQKIPGFVGTSNVYLAKKYGVKPVGTMAHECMMTRITDPQYNPAYVNSRVMKMWVKEFGIDNGIFLTDAIGRVPFLLDFTKTYATLFSGVRHDSGDPIEWGEDIIVHYKKLGIDPLTKTLLFSDTLDFERATKIKKHFDGRCRIAFGIGTYLAGVQDVPSLNIVMKVKECNGFPTCKLTDNPEKAMGDPEFIGYVQRSVDWRIRHESR